MTISATSSATSGTFELGRERLVHRLGYGTMRLPGSGVWGEPRDRGEVKHPNGQAGRLEHI